MGVTVLGAGCGIGSGSPKQISPDVVAIIESGFVGVATDGRDLWLSTVSENPDGGIQAEVVTVSAASGVTRGRQVIANGAFWRDLAYIDGHLVARVRDLESDVPRVELAGYQRFRDEVDELVTIDVQTMDVVDRFELPTFRAYDPLTVTDGTYWMHDPSGFGFIDLSTGEVRIGLGIGASLVDARQLDDELLLVFPQTIQWRDLDTRESTKSHRFDTSKYVGDPLHGRFKYHDGKFWASGSVFEDFENIYEYDIETGEHSNPIPYDDIPDRSLELGGYRWDLYRDDAWYVWRRAAEEGDLWRQVDSETGETVAEYDFGQFTPEVAAEGYLWLSRDLGEDGRELARMPLDTSG